MSAYRKAQHGRGGIRTLDTLSCIHAFQASRRKRVRVTQIGPLLSCAAGSFCGASALEIVPRDVANPSSVALRNTARPLAEHSAVAKSRVHRAIAGFSHSPENLEGAYTARTHAPSLLAFALLLVTAEVALALAVRR